MHVKLSPVVEFSSSDLGELHNSDSASASPCWFFFLLFLFPTYLFSCWADLWANVESVPGSHIHQTLKVKNGVFEFGENTRVKLPLTDINFHRLHK